MTGRTSSFIRNSWFAAVALMALAPRVQGETILEPGLRLNQEAWTLQAGVFGVEENALRRRAALEEKGYSPVRVEPNGKTFRVLVGRFTSLADAWAWREEMRSAGEEVIAVKASGAIASAKSTADDGLAVDSATMSVFGLAPGALKGAALVNLNDRREYAQLEALDVPGGEARYREALQKALATTPPDDPLRGYILANLGSLALKAGNLGLAREHLGAVAKGSVPSARNHRLMAMRRYAWVLHHQGDRINALLAYRAIQQQTDSRAILSTCEVEIAGLLFELAESGKGTHQDVRAHLANAWDRLEPADVNRATLELMFLETYARQPEPDYAKAAQLGEQFVAKWEKLGAKAPIREIGSAMYQTGMYHRRAGNDLGALQWYQRVLSEIPEDAPAFKSYHPHAQSLIGLAHIAAGAQNRDLRDDIKRELIESFPDDAIVKKIRETHPHLENTASQAAGELHEGSQQKPTAP